MMRIEHHRAGVPQFNRAILVLIAVLLTACEAPLVLDGVAAELERPIRRSDRFQAAVDNGKVITVVGSYGIILTSTDDGNTWTRHQIDEQPSLIDIAACPDGAMAALAVERKIWVSTDDGQTWRAKDTDSEETPQALTCDASGRLWVVGSFSAISSSLDLGDSWRMQSLNDDLILTHITFFDEHHGVVLGEFGTIARTQNSGETWELQDPLPNDFYPMAAIFSTPQRGWVAGLNGAILYTGDGGKSWQRTITGTDAPIYGFAAQDNELFAVGDFGIILHHVGTDLAGNLRWERKDPGYSIRFFLRAALPVNADRLLIGGAAGALHIIKIADLVG